MKMIIRIIYFKDYIEIKDEEDRKLGIIYSGEFQHLILESLSENYRLIFTTSD